MAVVVVACLNAFPLGMQEEPANHWQNRVLLVLVLVPVVVVVVVVVFVVATR